MTRQSSHDNPQATSWDDMLDTFGFTEAEVQEIDRRADDLHAQVRAHRLADVRKRQHLTQAALAALMGVSQARVSVIEKGDLDRSEVSTLSAYIAALGGKLRIVADFGEESLVIQ